MGSPDPAAARPGEPRARGGLQLEIVAHLFVVMLAGLAIVAVVMAGMGVQAVRESLLGRLEMGAAHLERFQRFHRMGLREFAAFVQTQEQRMTGGHWWVLDAALRPVPPSASELDPGLLALAEQALQQGGVVVHQDGFGMRVAIAERIEVPGSERGVLLGHVPPAELSRRWLPLFGSLAWVLVMAAAVFVGFGSYLLRGKIVRPLRELLAATQRMAAGDLAVRTEIAGSDELAELGRGFNEMAASLAREREALMRTSESLVRSQRLAAVGQLAAGVAHEVGNPVAAVLGYAELMLHDKALGERSRDCAERVRREALRVRALVHELLDLARPQSLGMASHAPARLLERAVDLLRAQPLTAGIELALDVPAELPDVQTDARRVEQILVNLIENAAHALRGQADAQIRVCARAEAVIQMPARRRGDPAPAGESGQRSLVRLQVIDNGPGIEPEVLPHIFDPFFTTKEPGEGTGLGLWNAHRLAELLGGRLEVETARGRTCFSLILPCADREPAGGQG